MKIAILSTGNLNDMKGVMNYVHEKALEFKKYQTQDLTSDYFFILTIYKGILSLFKKNDLYFKAKDGDIIRKNGVDYHLIIRYYSILEIIHCFIKRCFVSQKFAKKVYEITKDYDVISAHQLPAIYSAFMIKKIYGKPYNATWHGSDINVIPKASRRLFLSTKEVLENAEINYFVSKGLMKASEYITTNAKKDYLYTGPSSIFKKYSDEERLLIRTKLGVRNKKVITYTGNLIPIKNVMVLPSIFSTLSKKVYNDLEFWIIGNGILQNTLKKHLEMSGVNFKMLGKKEPSDIPDYMNCSDILIIPSLNEGFPLVILEARACGCNVVASNVGGLPESAGIENCFDLDNYFIDKISSRMAEIIMNDESPQPLPLDYSWESAVKKEFSFIKSVLVNK